MAESTSGRPAPEDDLAVAIAETRGGAGAGRTARALLERDGDGWLLVGLVGGGRRAVLYDAADWRVAAAPFDAGGVEGLAAETLARATHLGRLEAWIRDQGVEQWDWLHPRFRWVFGDDGECGEAG